MARVLQQIQSDKENHHGGHPSKFSPTNKCAIVQRILTGKASNAVQATHFINTIISTPVSSQTVRNTLKEASLKAVVKKKKPLLSVTRRKRRLAFALWTVEDWKRVIWSDETKINRIGSDEQEYVWKRKGKRLTSREVQGTIKFGEKSLMIWGCIGWNGVGVLSEVEGRMDAEQYSMWQFWREDHCRAWRILEFLQIMSFSNRMMIPSIRTSRRAKIWFEEQNIKLLDWPAQSPDLNPIEHTWGHFKRCLLGYARAPKGVHQLWDRVVVERGKIFVECQKWIESMPRRIQIVIKAKGGHTKY